MSVSRELIEACKIMVAREKSGEFTPEEWEEWTEAEIIGLAARPSTTVFVNVYQLDRVCGGAEEGGWWFDTGEPEVSITCGSEESAAHVAELLGETYRDNRNRYSVIYYLKSPDYRVEIDYKPAASFPAVFPHYE